MKWKNKGHELDGVGEKLKDRKTVILYGVSGSMTELFKRLVCLPFEMVFADDSLVGEMLGAHTIQPFDTVLGYLSGRSAVLVLTLEHENRRNMIRRKLLLKGFLENEDFFGAEAFQKIYLPILSLYSLDICYMDFLNHIPNYSCTLKCQDCSVSIPYLKKKNPTAAQLKREIDLIFKKVDFLYTYDCTGGETLAVSDDLVEVLEYLVLYYRNRIGEIAFTTNATLLPTEKMLQFLSSHTDLIRISVSRYDTVRGWREKFLGFQSLLEERRIPFTVVGVGSWIDFGFRKTTLDKTEEEMENYFDFCGDFQGNFCKALVDGKIYYCGHGHFANEAFYSEYDDSMEALELEDDAVDSRVIVEFNLGYQDKGYLGICWHCNGWGIGNQNFIPIAEQITGKNRGEDKLV